MNEGAIPGSMEVLNSFQMTEESAGLDRASKELCKNKEVLAIILKGAVREYADYSYVEIMDFIEGDSITNEKSVTPGLTNTRIRGDGKEFAALNEKLSDFDTEFTAINPGLSRGEILVRLHIDLEPQRTYRPGYPIEKRGIYYLAREFSAQLSLVTADTDYNRLEKCYSIWICKNDVPNDEKFSISVIEMSNTANYGDCHPEEANYDLLTLVIIRLGDDIYRHMEDTDKDHMMEFVHAIMYPHREDFLDTIKKRIDFSNNKELWKEVDDMTGLGASVMYDGYVKGIQEGRHNLLMAVRSLMRKQNLTAEEALDEMDIPMKDRAEYLAQL